MKVLSPAVHGEDTHWTRATIFIPSLTLQVCSGASFIDSSQTDTGSELCSHLGKDSWLLLPLAAGEIWDPVGLLFGGREPCLERR